MEVAGRSRDRMDAVVIVCVVCIAAQLAVIVWNAQQSTLFSDDWLNFLEYRQAESFWRWLTISVFGQLLPGHRLLTALVLEVSGPSYVVTQTLIAVLALGATGLMIRCLLLLGLRPLTAGLLVLLAVLSPVHAHVLQWWSSAQSIVASVFFMLLAMLLAIEPRWFRSVSRRSLAVGLAYGAALAFYSKVLYAILPLAVVVVAWYGREPLALVALVRRCLGVLAYAIGIALVYVAVLKTFGGIPAVHPASSPGFVLGYAAYGTLEGTLKAAVGLGANAYMVPADWLQGAWSDSAAAGPLPVLALLLSGLVLLVSVTVVAGTIRSGGWRLAVAWALLGVWLFASFMTIANTRGVIFGLDSALSPRYQSDNVYYLLVAVVALVRWSGWSAVPRSREVPQRSSAARGHVGAAAAALLITAAAIHGYTTLRPLWNMSDARSFTANLAADLKALDAGSVVLEDAELPEFVLPGWMSQRRLKHLVPVWRQDLRIASTAQATHAVRPDGRIVPLPR